LFGFWPLRCRGKVIVFEDVRAGEKGDKVSKEQLAFFAVM
jgi:hypothetical protein